MHMYKLPARNTNIMYSKHVLNKENNLKKEYKYKKKNEDT